MAEKKTWAILLYLSSDNSLSEEGVYALKELKKVGTPEVSVFAQFDPVGRGNPTRRILIDSADADGKIVEKDIVAELGETNMSDPETLRRFLVAGVRQFPKTTNFMVVLDGHGGGINEGFFLRDEERRLSEIPSSFPLMDLKDAVFDDDELIRELGPDRKIDILGFDSCLMSMVEVCYEIHDCDKLEYVVASEGFSLNAGWPYEKIVKRIKDKYLEPLDLATSIVIEHAKFYEDYHLGGLSTDLSVLKLKQIPNLRDRIGELADALIEKFENELKQSDRPDETETLPEKNRKFYYNLDGRKFQDAIILAHWAAQSYNGEQSIDLDDFCLLLQKRSPSFERENAEGKPGPIYQYCQKVREAIGDAVVLTCDEGAAFQFSRGVSISFPWSGVNIPPNYPTLRFSRDAPLWSKFINRYAEATQRLPQSRPQNNIRSTPPYSKGPEGRILSMRNPPTKFVERKC
jgi:hypothetical protein